MNGQILILLLGMSAVTLLPRILPAFIPEKIRFGRKGEKFLRLIPYTAMGALIFPGIFSVGDGKYYIGLAGGGVALILAFCRLPPILCVLGAVLADFLLYLLFP